LKIHCEPLKNFKSLGGKKNRIRGPQEEENTFEGFQEKKKIQKEKNTPKKKKKKFECNTLPRGNWKGELFAKYPLLISVEILGAPEGPKGLNRESVGGG